MARRINQESTGHGVNELNERKRRVLWAVVQDYADTAEPVGSRTIARKYDLGVSSATIRNEMQDLEDEGYLEQPHTSAGRIPSIKGYRFYVDWLMQPAPVSSEEEHMIDHMLMDHVNRQEEIFRNMAKAVAVLTHTLSVAASAGQKKKFNYVRFLPLDGRRAILLVVTDQGDVSNAVVDIPKGSSFDEMQLLADKLNHFLHGREIDHTDEEMILSFQRDVEKDLTPYLSVFQALQRAVSPQKEVYAGGASQLIEQPEFKNVEKMQDILNLLEQRDRCAYRDRESDEVALGSVRCQSAVHIRRPGHRLRGRLRTDTDAVQPHRRYDAFHAAATGSVIKRENIGGSWMKEDKKKVDVEEPMKETEAKEEKKTSPVDDLMDQLGEAKKTAEEAKNKAEAAESKLATSLSQYVRLQADFDNFRRRTREAEAKAADTHTAETLKAFLPVLDNFELALAHMKKDEGGAAYVQGFELLQKQFVKIMEGFGVKEIEALGKTFDPHFHEAVMMLPADDKEDETISMVFQKGYLYKDNVLRVAKVQVVHNG